jgi:hypothetical protein
LINLLKECAWDIQDEQMRSAWWDIPYDPEGFEMRRAILAAIEAIG